MTQTEQDIANLQADVVAIVRRLKALDARVDGHSHREPAALTVLPLVFAGMLGCVLGAAFVAGVFMVRFGSSF